MTCFSDEHVRDDDQNSDDTNNKDFEIIDKDEDDTEEPVET